MFLAELITKRKHSISISKKKKNNRTLEMEAQISRLLLKKINRKKYSDTAGAQSLVAVMVAHFPKVSLQVIQRIVSLSLSSLLLDVGIDIYNVSYPCLSAATLKHLVFEESGNTILLQR